MDIGEEWRPVLGLEVFIEVSNEGRLRSLVRAHPRGGTRGGRVLKLAISIHGYPFARVSHAGSKTNVYVHRAVAEAFLPNPLAFPQVNHKDGVKRNGSLSNLEWCTASENSQHKYSVLGMAGPKRAVIAERDGAIRHYPSLTAASLDGFCLYNISAVLNGRRKRCGGFTWRFA